LIITGSEDGSIRIYDTVSSQLINIIRNAHSGTPISSVTLTRSGRYLLSGGKDGWGRLWDMSNGACIVQYGGGGGKV